MKKSIIIPTMLVGILLIAGSAFAWPSGHNNRNYNGFQGQRGQGMTYVQHKENMGNQLERMGVILDLTTQQKEQLESIFEQQWQDRQSMRTDRQVSREDLRGYNQGKDFNEDEFRAKAQKHTGLRTEMLVQFAKTRQQIFSVLTSEQQQKAEKLREFHGEGFFGQYHGDRDGAGYGRHSNNRNCDGYGNRGQNSFGLRYHN